MLKRRNLHRERKHDFFLRFGLNPWLSALHCSSCTPRMPGRFSRFLLRRGCAASLRTRKARAARGGRPSQRRCRPRSGARLQLQTRLRRPVVRAFLFRMLFPILSWRHAFLLAETTRKAGSVHVSHVLYNLFDGQRGLGQEPFACFASQIPNIVVEVNPDSFPEETAPIGRRTAHVAAKKLQREFRV